MVCRRRQCTKFSDQLYLPRYCTVHQLGLVSVQPLIVQAFLRRCKKLRYCDDNLPSTANLFDDADNQLFRSILANGEHILHHYMPQHTTLSHCRHYLRQRKHNKELIPKTRTLNSKDFIVGMLYKNMY